jgi:diguanylate cyclase (GGDEF)-like protein
VPKLTAPFRGYARALFAWVLVALPIFALTQAVERQQRESARVLGLERSGVAALRASFTACETARSGTLRKAAERWGLADDGEASLTRLLDAVVQRWPLGCARLDAATKRLQRARGRDRAAYAQRVFAIAEEAAGQATLVAGAEAAMQAARTSPSQDFRPISDAQRVARDVSAYVRAVNRSFGPRVDRLRALRAVDARNRAVLADTTLAARHAIDAMDRDLQYRIERVSQAERLGIGLMIGALVLLAACVAFAYRAWGLRRRDEWADARRRVDRLSADFARAQALSALAVSETQFRALFDGTTTGVALLDRGGAVVKRNAALERLVPSGVAASLGAEHPDFEALWQGRCDAIAFEIDPGHEIASRALEVNLSVIRDARGTALFVMSLVRDITERKQADRALLHQATHDSLTGLPNRILFFDQLRVHVECARGEIGTSAVFFIDLDDFKSVNDSVGHEWGDAVLIAAAQRLRTELPSHLVARLGGDEFGVLLRDCASRADVERIARLLVAAFLPPLAVAGREVFVTITVGVAFGEPATTQTASMLVRDADIAMYHAKRSGRARYALFDTNMHEAVVRKSVLVSEMRKALDRDDFFVAYQPIVDLSDRSTRSFEALARWHHRQLGRIAPTEFIPVAEQSGMIVALGEAVLRDACSLVTSWRRNPSEDAGRRVSINVSVNQLLTIGFPERAAEIVRGFGLHPSCFTLEVTESGLLAAGEGSNEALARLKRAGFGLSLDDFGTGYSSLGYLQRFPFDELKIDRCFVHAADGSLANPPIVSMVVALARSLGMLVVAEGVETAQQADQLRALGCTRAQGFYFAGAIAAAPHRAPLSA